jgi:hypothetical protein
MTVGGLTAAKLAQPDGQHQGTFSRYVPHFVAAEHGAVVVQLSGTGRFHTAYVEK